VDVRIQPSLRVSEVRLGKREEGIWGRAGVREIEDSAEVTVVVVVAAFWVL